MRKTGVSVARCTSLSRRLSRISIDCKCCRPSVGFGVSVNWISPPCQTIAKSSLRFSHDSIRRDDRADVLAIERPCQIAALQPVDYLNRAAIGRSWQQLQNTALDDHILQVELGQFGHRDLRNKLGAAILLRVGGVKAVFVFDEDHRLRSED